MRNYLKAAILTLSVTFSGAARCEENPMMEKMLQEATIRLEQGDIHNALVLTVRVLSTSDDQETRNQASERLQKMGLSRPEIFKLDTQSLQGETLQKLVAKLTEYVLIRERAEADMTYAMALLNLCVSARPQADGGYKIEAKRKELGKSLELLIDLALGGVPEVEGEAQTRLRELGISGGRVESVKSALQKGDLPAESEDDVIAGVGLWKLERLRERVTEDGNEDEQVLRRKISRETGLRLFAALEHSYGRCPAFTRNQKTADFWRAENNEKKPNF